MSSRNSNGSRDTDRFLLDVRPDAISQPVLRDQVNPRSQMVLQENPELHKCGEPRRPIESDEEIHIAAVGGFVTRHRSEQTQGLYAKSLKFGRVRFQDSLHFIARYRYLHQILASVSD